MSPSPDINQSEATTLPMWREFVFLLAFSVFHFTACFAQSADKPLWLDELFTFHIASSPTATGVITALKTGAETHPPATYLLGHYLIPILGDANGIRFSAMVGYWVMAVCLYVVVSRAYNFLSGILAMLLPYLTGTFFYAYEGRAYGILLGCAGLTFLAWSQTQRPKCGSIWYFVIPVCIAVAIWSHFYAVLVGVPLILGEVAVIFFTRKVRYSVWISLLAGYTALIPLAGLIRAIRTNVQADRGSVGYWLDFAVVSEALLQHLWAVAILACVFIVTHATLAQAPRPNKSTTEADVPGFNKAQLVVGISFSLMPVWVQVLCSIVSGFYLPRHAILVVFGISLLVVPALWSIGRPNKSILMVIIAACTLLWVAEQARVLKHLFLSKATLLVRQNVLPQIELPGTLPVVVQDARLELKWLYYAPPSLCKRLRYLGSPELGLAYTGSSVMDRAMLGLNRITPVQVERYEDFIMLHPKFLAYFDAAPTEEGEGGWLIRKLIDSNAKLQVLAHKGSQFLYLVNLGSPNEIASDYLHQ